MKVSFGLVEECRRDEHGDRASWSRPAAKVSVPLGGDVVRGTVAVPFAVE